MSYFISIQITVITREVMEVLHSRRNNSYYNLTRTLHRMSQVSTPFAETAIIHFVAGAD